MDNADRAQELIEQNLADAMQARRQEQSRAASAHECMDCGEDIPQERRNLVPGCVRCTECESAWQKRNHR